jgi:hypothetical protein
MYRADVGSGHHRPEGRSRHDRRDDEVTEPLPEADAIEQVTAATDLDDDDAPR